MQTNLYDFLRSIRDFVTHHGEHNPRFAYPVSAEEYAWINQYLEGPDVEIHFKSKKVGEENGEPIMAADYSIKGEPVYIFSLLTEAMMQNGFIADTVLLASRFYLEHTPTCKDCRERLQKARVAMADQIIDYTFKPHE